MNMIHGGDVTGYRERYGRFPLDFSASLNPAGMPRAVREAALRAVDESTPYPDPKCRELRAAVAERFGVPGEFLFFGNGAADVIHRFAQALCPRLSLLPIPAFAEYEQALAAFGCPIRYHVLDRRNGFRLDSGILPDITPDIDAIFLCQPNNPTGLTVEPELLRAILDRADAVGAVLFLDECFCRFVDGGRNLSMVGELSRRNNLFILDSFTKLYAMAGIRLGFGMCGDVKLIERLHAAGQPWPVSTIAQAAGLAALGETEYVADSLKTISEAKAELLSGLKRLGVVVLGHAANYVFFQCPVPELDTRLMEEGILIRNCRNFRGLGDGYYRLAVRLPNENAMLLQAIEKVANT